MRITESQLRRVVRRLVNEQTTETSPPLYYTNPEGEEIHWGDVQGDIEMELESSETRPSRRVDVNLKKVMRAAKAAGYPNLPQDFLQQIAENLTDLAHEMY